MEDTRIYRTLEDIADRRDEIRDQLRDNDRLFREKWHSLFKRDDAYSALSPTRRMTKLVQQSAGLIDGAILAWKLYRTFKKKKR